MAGPHSTRQPTTGVREQLRFLLRKVMNCSYTVYGFFQCSNQPTYSLDLD